MELRQLQSYVAVVKHKSFTKAAEELYISQPTISSHIRDLEESLNQQLIIRTTKHLQITTAGLELFECAKQMLSLQNNLLHRLGGHNGRMLHIGASTIPTTYILPHILTKFCKLHKNFLFKVHQSDSSEVLQGLKRGEYDLAFSGMPCKEESICCEPFFDDEMLIITPHNEHFLQYKADGIEPYSLFYEEPVIIREEGSASQKTADKIYEHLHLNKKKMKIVARVNEPESIKNFVSKGFGISIISKIAVESYIKNGDILSFTLPAEISGRKLYMLYHNYTIEDEFLNLFIQFVKEEYAY